VTREKRGEEKWDGVISDTGPAPRGKPASRSVRIAEEKEKQEPVRKRYAARGWPQRLRLLQTTAGTYSWGICEKGGGKRPREGVSKYVEKTAFGRDTALMPNGTVYSKEHSGENAQRKHKKFLKKRERGQKRGKVRGEESDKEKGWQLNVHAT